MDLSIGDLFANPDHYLFMFEAGQAVFRPMDRAAYGRSIFLDDRIDAAAPGAMKIPVAPLLDHLRLSAAPPDIGWIFHVAHCGSTLLARGLDRRDQSLVLREPVPLRQLAVEGAQPFAGGVVDHGWRAGLGLAVAMAGKRYAAAQRVIVKANVPVNFILGEVMAQTPAAKGVLLYFDWENYLLAILRSAEHRRWVRYVTSEMAPAIRTEVGALEGLVDAELAAALWLAQMRIYVRALEQWPQLRSLNAERLFAAPSEIIAAAAMYFGLPAPTDDMHVGGVIGSYAKNPGMAFDNDVRLERRHASRLALADEIDQARSWLARREALPGALVRPL